MPRTREILQAGIAHLHAFVREPGSARTSSARPGVSIARLGQMTTRSHNEVMLAAGSLGVSALVCLLNNDDRRPSGTTANLLGPFWRAGAPRTPNGGSIVRSPTPGAPVFVKAWVRDRTGGRWRAPRSTSGTRRPRASTRTRIRRRPT